MTNRGETNNHTVIMGITRTQSISIASVGKTFNDDAYTNSDAQKDIGVIDIVFTDIPTAIRSMNSDNYDDIGLVSYDAVFCPYTTASGHSNLPYWETPSTGLASGTITANHLNPYNPNYIYTGGSRTGAVNPQVFYDSGHNIQIYNGLTSVGYGTNQDLSPHKGLAETRSPLVNNVRSIGLKAPVVITGPGYDTSGQPVPSGGTGIFHADAFNDPSLWKSGPLDIRWNDDKKMWVAPSTGGGGYTVGFQISAVVDGCGTCSVTARIISVPYGTDVSSLPGLETDSAPYLITVWDQMGCHLNKPDDEIANLKGFATYFELLEDGPCLDMNADGTGYWLITSLCCSEQNCST
jgi:hypothetical protein